MATIQNSGVTWLQLVYTRVGAASASLLFIWSVAILLFLVKANRRLYDPFLVAASLFMALSFGPNMVFNVIPILDCKYAQPLIYPTMLVAISFMYVTIARYAFGSLYGLYFGAILAACNTVNGLVLFATDHVSYTNAALECMSVYGVSIFDICLIGLNAALLVVANAIILFKRPVSLAMVGCSATLILKCVLKAVPLFYGVEYGFIFSILNMLCLQMLLMAASPPKRTKGEKCPGDDPDDISLSRIAVEAEPEQPIMQSRPLEVT